MIEVFNSNGALTARAVVSQRVPAGMTMMYHAQERIVNLPGSEITQQRGGIHNSVTRITPKPTHMIGGYAQLAYGFNYYGTVGSNRDEFVVVRKMKNINWLDGEGNDRTGERKMKIRSQVGMVLNLDKCIGCHTCSVTCKNVWTSREGMEYARFNNVESKPGVGFPNDWENQEKWKGGWIRKINGKLQPRMGNRALLLGKIFANPHLPGIDDYYEPFDYDYQNLHTAPESKHQPIARPRSLITGQRMDKITSGPNWEEILGGEFEKRAKDQNFENMQKAMYGQFENTFMMYLPRLCEHCLNPACVATCPSGAIYKREEDGIVLIDQTSAAAGVCASPAARTRRFTSTGRAGSPRSASSATRVSKRVSRPFAPKPVLAVSVILAYCCMTPMPLKALPVRKTKKICTSVNWTCSSIRTIRLSLSRR